MKKDFQSESIVKFNIPDGGRAKIVKYLKEGFYLIRTIPENRELIAHEDDISLDGEYKWKYFILQDMVLEII